MNAQETMPTALDWSKTSADYAKYRPGYPEKFFNVLEFLGVGLPEQDILDLGAGTGALSIPFAIQEANVTANDITPAQIEELKAIAQRHRFTIKTIVSPAEELEFSDATFDCVTASMCWGYLNKDVLVPNIKKWLKKDGVLLISSLIWTAGDSPIALKTEELLKSYNPEWRNDNQKSNHNSKIVDEALIEDFELITYHKFRYDLPFTLESWRGRIRACKGMGACYPQETVNQFDQELEQALQPMVKGKFFITHNITIRIYGVKR